MGHEFTGIVEETGDDVKTVKKGDQVVSPFTTSWYLHLQPRLDCRLPACPVASASTAHKASPPAASNASSSAPPCSTVRKQNTYACPSSHDTTAAR